MEKKQLVLRIGGVSVCFWLKNQKMYSALESRYAGYILNHTKGKSNCDFEFNYTFTSKAFNNRIQVKLIRSGDEFQIIRRDVNWRWNVSSEKKSGLTVGAIESWPSVYAFDAGLRVWLSYVLPLKGGFLMHSSAIIVKNKAYLFCGPSGAGKTTISRLSGARILNDEIVTVKKTTDGFKAYGTPFWGEMGSGPVYPKGYPLNGIMLLKQHQIDNIISIEMGLALPKILRCVCNFESSSDTNKRILTLSIELLKDVRTSILEFTKSNRFLKFLG